MAAELSRSAQRVRDALAARGAPCEVVELPASTRTAADAAAAVGCSVAQIAKSIVFRTVQGGKPVLVIASGANRVDESKVAAYLGGAIQNADADYVRAQTGFAIGGVPPVGHAQPIATIVDEDLLALGEVWAAAGTPNAVFKLAAANLPALTAGVVKSIK
jgi:prolyl-tRNA editing enzyme YbaK/EbsC (Cys-tRNA(Pro) deacylase)